MDSTDSRAVPRAFGVLALCAIIGVALAACTRGSHNETPPEAGVSQSQLATFGGGCFWCTEAIYRRLEGVISAKSGYAGGHVENPSYEQVCTGSTGHAEVIRVRYDPSKVRYEDLLEVFWKTHDPTTVDRQGHDVGTQYRSVVFFHDPEQQKTAQDLKARLDASGAFPAPIVTEIVPYDRFFEAEEYHQDYFAENPEKGYCRAVIAPKVEKFEKVFRDRLKR